MLKPLTFEGRFECGFDDIVRGKTCAVFPIHTRVPGSLKEGPVGLGIAIANEPGYHLVPLHWAHADSLDEMQAHADALNRELFKLDPQTAATIVASTMFKRRGRSR